MEKWLLLHGEWESLSPLALAVAAISVLCMVWLILWWVVGGLEDE